MKLLTLIGNILTVITIVISIIFVGRQIFLNKKRLSKYEETFIMALIVVCYIFNLMEKVVYDGKEGKWFNLIMPTGNLSPFLFTLTALFIFIPYKFRRYYYSIISLMIVGMIGASFYNSVGRLFSFDPWIYTCNSFDCYGHVIIGLLGIYCIRNSIIEFNKKEKIVSIVSIYTICIFMLIHNVIFKTAFFGLGLYGNHNIYNLVLTKSSILSAIIYFVGLTIILIVGCKVIDIIKKVSNKIDSKEES